MRNFRDAKSMAHTLREALAAKHYKISVGESLELIAHLFGVSDWNTLSATIKESDQEPKQHDRPGKSRGLHFAATTEAALSGALQAASERGQAESKVEHLLLSLMEDPDVIAILKAHKIDPAQTKRLLASRIEMPNTVDRTNTTDPSPSAGFQRVVQRAILICQTSGEWNITGAHLLLAIFTEQEGTVVETLREIGLNRSHVANVLKRPPG